MTETTNTHPPKGQDIFPIKQFLYQWEQSPIFFQDFICCCPFNKLLVQYFHSLTRLHPVSLAWQKLFTYLTSIYSVEEIGNLVYEALHDLNLNEVYLLFLDKHNYYYIWPTGKHFIDPLIEAPPQPQIGTSHG